MSRPNAEDFWRALLRFHGVLQVRFEVEREGRGWVVIEQSFGGVKELGRGRSMAAAVRAAHRDTVRRAGF